MGHKHSRHSLQKHKHKAGVANPNETQEASSSVSVAENQQKWKNRGLLVGKTALIVLFIIMVVLVPAVMAIPLGRSNREDRGSNARISDGDKGEIIPQLPAGEVSRAMMPFNNVPINMPPAQYNANQQYVLAQADRHEMPSPTLNKRQRGGHLKLRGQQNKRIQPASNTFALNSYSSSDQKWPSVTSLPDGTQVAVWRSYGREYADQWSIVGQLLDVSGNKIGSEFSMASSSQANDLYAALKVFSLKGDGRFIVTWLDSPSPGTAKGQIYDVVSGAVVKRSGEITFNNITSTRQTDCVVQSLENGNFIAVCFGPYSGSSNIFMREYSGETGLLIKSGTFYETKVDLVTLLSSYRCRMDSISLSANRLMTTYINYNTGKTKALFFNTDGSEIVERDIYAAGSTQTKSAGVKWGDGFLAITDDTSGSLRYTTYDIGGSPNGTGVLNTGIAEAKTKPVATLGADGNLVVVFQVGDKSAIAEFKGTDITQRVGQPRYFDTLDGVPTGNQQNPSIAALQIAGQNKFIIAADTATGDAEQLLNVVGRIFSANNTAPFVANPMSAQTVSHTITTKITVPADTFVDADINDELTLSCTSSVSWTNCIQEDGVMKIVATPPKTAVGLAPISVELKATDLLGSSCVQNVPLSVKNVTPTITRCSFTINDGEFKKVTVNELNAIDPDDPDTNLLFDISNPTHVSFEKAGGGAALEQILQSDIVKGEFYIRHDGSGKEATVLFKVSDGLNSTAYIPANFKLDVENTQKEETGSSANESGAFYNAPWFAPCVGAIGLALSIAGILLRMKHYNKKGAEQKEIKDDQKKIKDDQKEIKEMLLSGGIVVSVANNGSSNPSPPKPGGDDNASTQVYPGVELKTVYVDRLQPDAGQAGGDLANNVDGTNVTPYSSTGLSAGMFGGSAKGVDADNSGFVGEDDSAQKTQFQVIEADPNAMPGDGDLTGSSWPSPSV